ncbi:hypothetical protein IFU30_10950 [Plantibacter sp. CFBP 8798]|uniref:hypothetical protein n=1 Tax=Plantibacter sp. CFBP 8798 TaxID=2775268 RepID=UPI0017859662|nr:hypothetical protein [Plantibacter sp. CFBP 8798]MBD8466785.1 hypothetical protein [Plantibacter sp. CFBP 8798]
MNKTAIFITFACLAALGIAGTLILQIHRPDATATFTSFIIQILGLVSLAAATFYGFGKANEKTEAQNSKLEVIERNTNGRLHSRDAEIQRLTNVLIEKGIDPNEGGPKHLA